MSASKIISLKELAKAVDKATRDVEFENGSVRVGPPKRKHVRTCIVYTFQHKSSVAFWQDLLLLPLYGSDIRLFKALATAHKILHEGHSCVVRKDQGSERWLSAVQRNTAQVQGASLIRQYATYLERKLAFHREHPHFPNDFDYKEGVSLVSVENPNTGYTIVEALLKYLDRIMEFKTSVFNSLAARHDDCYAYPLISLVSESYAIYKYLVAMLRALHTALDNSDVLSQLRESFNSHHYQLRDFYEYCMSIRSVNSIIDEPRLSKDPPNLFSEEERPDLPARPAEPSQPVSTVSTPEPEPVQEFWKTSQNQEDEQKRLQQEWQAQQQAMWAAQAQFEEQQRLLAEEQQKRLAEEQQRAMQALAAQQAEQQTRGRLAELEQETLNNQFLLSRYDQRVKAYETELEQLRQTNAQLNSHKDEQIRMLQEQVNNWRSKYEALAKLYTMLRNEHLTLIKKHKEAQLKANSAQEANDKREKLERDIKSKNLELAGMIRERDRALHDKDRMSANHKEEIKRLERELQSLKDKLDGEERGKGAELSSMISRHNREIADLEEALRHKNKLLDEVQRKASEGDSDIMRQLRAKEEELEIFKAGMDQTLLQLSELKKQNQVQENIVDGELDTLVQDNIRRLGEVVDSALQVAIVLIEDGLYELESVLHSGNQSATGVDVLNILEKAGQNATNFSTSMNAFIADGPGADTGEVIRMIVTFTSGITDVLTNTKGITRMDHDEKKIDQLLNGAKQCAQKSIKFFRSVTSYKLADVFDPEQKIEIVISHNLEVQRALKELSTKVEPYAQKSVIGNQKDIDQVVENELARVAEVIEQAEARLRGLQSKDRSQYSTFEIKIHDSILDAAMAITTAIAALIKAATDAQAEIVREGRGTSSKTAFYKKNNRWTEGLISAAKAVAYSTNTLIETADSLISGGPVSEEHLIVACNEVMASTAQLVAASRVKVHFMSETQNRLEKASKAVTAACRALVRRVEEITSDRNKDSSKMEDFTTFSRHELKTKEMEQQIEIRKLQKGLDLAIAKLGEMRKASYLEE